MYQFLAMQYIVVYKIWSRFKKLRSREPDHAHLRGNVSSDSKKLLC